MVGFRKPPQHPLLRLIPPDRHVPLPMALLGRTSLLDDDAIDLAVVMDQWLQGRLLLPGASNAALDRIHDVLEAIVDVMHVEAGLVEVQLHLELELVVSIIGDAGLSNCFRSFSMHQTTPGRSWRDIPWQAKLGFLAFAQCLLQSTSCTQSLLRAEILAQLDLQGQFHREPLKR